MELLRATLLSKEEATSFLTQKEREYSAWWWLRSPYDSYYATVVDSGGWAYNFYYVTYTIRGIVRPALIINLESSDLKIGDIFEFGGKEFKILSPTIAWMHKDDIGRCAFRTDWKADNANDYESSDVKKFVDEWFETNRSSFSFKEDVEDCASETSDDCESEESETKLTCRDCAHYDVCVIMESSVDDNKENYLVDFGCKDFLEKSLDVKPGLTVYFTYKAGLGYIIKEGTVLKVLRDSDGDWFMVRHIVSSIVGSYTDQWYRKSDIGESVFLSREAVEEYIKARKSEEA